MTDTQPSRSAPPGPALPYDYDAFVSYSTAADRDLSAKLQHHIERMGLPPYRRRRVRIFRDFTSLSADADLQRVIEGALARSRRFILLLSPEAAKSPWVNKEVQWWRDHRSADDVILVLTSGVIRWDGMRGDWDWTEDAPLPPALRGMFTAEPLWVDLTDQKTRDGRPNRKERERARLALLNGCATIGAPLRSMDKDELYGAHIAQLRRARQRLTGGLVLLSLLLAVALVAGLIARHQTAVARDQTRVAIARALASASTANLDDRLDLAQLLAVEAYRMDPGPRARAALYQAVTAQPRLVRYLSAGARVTQVTGTRDAGTVVAGTADGTVTRWTGERRRRQVLGRLHGAVTGVAVNRGGSVVAASSAAGATVWAEAQGVRRIPAPRGESGQLVAVSPSGRRILLYSVRNSQYTGTLTLFDRATGRTTRARTGWAGAMTVPTDREAVVLSEEGVWERRALPGLALRAKGGISVGNVLREDALSADGKRFAFVFGDVAFPFADKRMGVWPTQRGAQDYYHPPLQAGTAGPRPSFVALSSDGSRSATVANGVIHVSAVGRAGADLPAMTQLRGNARVAQDTVAFLGRGDRLVSGAGSLVAEWDLRQTGRIGSARAIRAPTTCIACVESPVLVSPDGKTAAVAGTSGDGIWLYSLGGDRRGSKAEGRRVVPAVSDEYPFEPVAWSPSGRRLYFVRQESPVLESYDVRTGKITSHFRVAGGGRPVLLSVSRDSRRLLALSEKAVTEVDLRTGRPLRTVALAHEVTATLSDNTWVSKALAVDPAWRRAAVFDGGNGHVLLVDLRTGRAVPLSRGQAYRVSYEGGYLAVGLVDGSVDLYDIPGAHRLRTIPQGLQAVDNSFALDRRGTLLAQYRDDGTVMLTDPRDGQPLGALPLSPPFVSPKASLRFTPDGNRLVVFLQDSPLTDSAEVQGMLQQWDMTPGSWTSAACRTAGRDLTPTEWRRYAGPQIPDDLRCVRDRN